MEHASATEPLLLNCRQNLSARVAAVDDNRKSQLLGQAELSSKDLGLDGSRGVIVMMVDPDLPDRRDLPRLRQTADRLEMGRGEVFGLMGLDSGRSRYPGEFLPEIENSRQALRRRQFDGTEDCSDSAGPGPPDDLLAARGNLGHV